MSQEDRDMDKDIRDNQAHGAHMLYFDPINQPRIPGDDGRFKPGNFEDVPGLRCFDDGSFEVTFYAPGAHSVRVEGIGGSMPGSYEMAPAGRVGYWRAEIRDVPPGFHYVRFFVDGVQTYHPQLPFGYGCSMAMNYLEVPDPKEDFYLLKDVPHGTLRMEIYHSSVTGRFRNCWVYTPPSYERESSRRYPALYLQHGGGENELGWIWQGKVNYIMDNLLAEDGCEEMIIVMNCGYSFIRRGEGVYSLERPGDVFCEDCVPFIDARYRTRADSASRAIAGLSFGSYHARTTAFDNPGIFRNLGLFSGGFEYKSPAGPLGGAYDYSETFKDAATFNSAIDLMFVGAGEQEQPMCGEASAKARAFADSGYNIRFYSTPGYHEWDVWRNCAREMIRMLFRRG
jgi:enterochelin esterase-like enzyme